jgi:polysaccharide chain length determinant protein (PEP-CTERM system associated)
VNELLGTVYGFARAAWRRRWWAVAAAWLIAVPGWLYVLTIPDRYEASARVFVDARTALRPVLEGIAIEEDYDSQLSLVREALLSRPQLETVARQTNLDAKAASPAQLDDLVTSLQNEIAVVSATAGNGEGRDTIYTIAYQNENRDTSVNVVRTLLDNFVEGTRSGTRTGAGEGREFIDGQIADVEKRMRDAEAELADFKKRNIGMIPGEAGDYFARMDRERAGLQASQTSLAVAVGRRNSLQRELAGSTRFTPGTAGEGGRSAANSSDVSIRRQEAEQRKEDLLLRYTDRHPEVIAITQTIEELKAREATELAELQRGGTGTGIIRSLNANPVYQQIQVQLSEANSVVAEHQSAVQQHQREIANLQRFVNQAPEIEQEYSGLNRDYEGIKQLYEQLVAKREQARVSDDAARSGSMRFDVIEPPRASSSPVSPNRPLLMIAVLFLAVAAGISLSILPHLLRPTFDDVAALERRLGLPVLGAVSVVRSAAYTNGVTREAFKVMFAGGALVVLAGLMIVAGPASARLVQGLIT